jgi:hypothetical protein
VFIGLFTTTLKENVGKRIIYARVLDTKEFINENEILIGNINIFILLFVAQNLTRRKR